MKAILLVTAGIGLAAMAACSADDRDEADYAGDPNCVAAQELGDGLFLCVAGGPPAELSPDAEVPADVGVQLGRAFIGANCSACHATGMNDESPLEGALPFRDLHERYPVENLAESLAEGIVTGHSGMPQFALTPEMIADVIAYLKTLE